MLAASHLAQKKKKRNERRIVLLLGRDDFVAACEHWEEAVKVAPLHEETWFAFGFAAIKKGDHDRALQAFSRSVQLEPTNAEALNNIAAIHIQRGNLQPAFVALQVSGSLSLFSSFLFFLKKKLDMYRVR